MSTVSLTRYIDGGPARIWQVFTDLPTRPDWLCAVDRVEVLTTGPFAVGTAWRETRIPSDGSPVTEELLVLAAEPPRLLVVASQGAGVDYLTTYRFRPADRRRARSGTKVTVVHEGAYRARSGRWVGAVLGGLAARAVEGVLRRDLADLAAAVGRAAGSPAGSGPAEAA
nr:SRPBCC family protein [Micromonospora sp. DSM 115978]